MRGGFGRWLLIGFAAGGLTGFLVTLAYLLVR